MEIDKTETMMIVAHTDQIEIEEVETEEDLVVETDMKEIANIKEDTASLHLVVHRHTNNVVDKKDTQKEDIDPHLAEKVKGIVIEIEGIKAAVMIIERMKEIEITEIKIIDVSIAIKDPLKEIDLKEKVFIL